MILEWDVPFWLYSSVNLADTSPAPMALPLNDLVTLGSDDLGYYLLDPAKCSAGAARRVTRNNLAQADGEITHRKFKSGYVIELNVQLWERIGSGGVPACAGTLRQMGDTLAGYLESISNDDGQLIWQPSEWPAGSSTPNRRMLDQARTLGPSGNDSSGASFVAVGQEKDAETPLTDITFALLSPFPYVTDYMNWPTTPDETASWTGGDHTITNIGNVAYRPVIRVYGPADGFTLYNLSILDETGNPLSIVYDDTLPGAIPIPSGGYVEIDTFTNVAKVHQPGGGTDNAKTCIDSRETDYFGLVPGDNDLSLLWDGGPGTHIEIDYRNAWA